MGHVSRALLIVIATGLMVLIAALLWLAFAPRARKSVAFNFPAVCVIEIGTRQLGQYYFGGPQLFSSVGLALSCSSPPRASWDRAARGPAMPEPTKLQIIRRAFELWQQAGCPEGKDKGLCRQAERELRNEKKSPSASKFAEPQEKSEQRHALSVSQADIVLSMKHPRRGTLSAAGFL